MSNPLSSVNDARPIEQGGPHARHGFAYQDLIAVGHLLGMLQDPLILNVQCETHDDVVVVRNTLGAEIPTADFVQVKATQGNSLWSVAMLCDREKGKSGTSVLERSLMRDAYLEAATFRIVTLRDIRSELKPLIHPPGSAARIATAADLAKLRDQIADRLPDLVSPKANGVAYWLDHLVWEVRYGEREIRESNIGLLRQQAIADGRTGLMTNLDSLHEQLQAMASEAARKSWTTERTEKIIKRDTLLDWWRALREDNSSQVSNGSTDPDYARDYFEKRWPQTSEAISQALTNCGEWMMRLTEGFAANRLLSPPYDFAQPWIGELTIAATEYRNELRGLLELYRQRLMALFDIVDRYNIVKFPRSDELRFAIIVDQIKPGIFELDTPETAELDARDRDRLARFLKMFDFADFKAARSFLLSNDYTVAIAKVQAEVTEAFAPLHDTMAQLHAQVGFFDVALGSQEPSHRKW